jgi:hypothetical protein
MIRTYDDITTIQQCNVVLKERLYNIQEALENPTTIEEEAWLYRDEFTIEAMREEVEDLETQLKSRLNNPTRICKGLSNLSLITHPLSGHYSTFNHCFSFDRSILEYRYYGNWPDEHPCQEDLIRYNTQLLFSLESKWLPPIAQNLPHSIWSISDRLNNINQLIKRALIETNELHKYGELLLPNDE